MKRNYLFLLVLTILLGGSFLSAVNPVQAITPTPAPAQSTPTPPITNSGINSNSPIQTTSTFFQMIKPIVEVFAIIVGAWWAYRTFIRTRLNFPYAELSQTITQVSLPSVSFTEDKILLNVTLTLHNAGNILIPLALSETRIQQILPLHVSIKDAISKKDTDRKSTDIPWPELQYLSRKWEVGEVEIEPGESEQIEYEFILDRKAQVIKVYSYVSNTRKKKSGLGWHATKIYKLEE